MTPGSDKEDVRDLMSVDVELRTPIATLQAVRFHLPGEAEQVLVRDCFWLDLCLTPRPTNARICFPEHWGPHRYEPLGDLFMIPPGEVAHVRRDSAGDQTSIICLIEPKSIDQWLEHSGSWTDRRLEAMTDLSSGTIRHLLGRLAEEARDPGTGSRRLVELVAGQLAIELARYCDAVSDGPISGGLASWRLRLIEERLQQPGGPPNLKELAGICGLSVRQLTRGFRVSRGVSVGDYINHKRIDTAKRMLAGHQNIKSIAFALGFNSPSGFSSAFRKATAMTPRQFRQRLLNRI